MIVIQTRVDGEAINVIKHASTMTVVSAVVLIE